MTNPKTLRKEVFKKVLENETQSLRTECIFGIDFRDVV